MLTSRPNTGALSRPGRAGCSPEVHGRGGHGAGIDGQRLHHTLACRVEPDERLAHQRLHYVLR